MVPISELTLCYEDIMQIDRKYLPMPVFTFNPGAFFTFGVAARTKGDWSHFMWMTAPGVFASQGLWFQRKTLDDYKKCTIKFVYNPGWTDFQRQLLLTSLLRDLDKSPWETRYDVLALVGHLLGLKWIQSGRFEICSDSADHIKLVDGRYDLKDPDPSDVNAWMKKHKWALENPYGHLVYGRYFGRD